MIIDEYGLIRTEHDTMPGAIGDSCAESARYYLLKKGLYQMTKAEEVNFARAFRHLRTDQGYLRHPLAPEGWRESDFVTDQALHFISPFKPAMRSWLKRCSPEFELLTGHWGSGGNQLLPPSGQS
jgi:hypothetical protein